jgi:hypothetical protein
MCIIGQWRCGSMVNRVRWVGAQKAISLRALRAGFAFMLSIGEFAERALEDPSACAGWEKRRSLKLVRNLLKGEQGRAYLNDETAAQLTRQFAPFAQLL